MMSPWMTSSRLFLAPLCSSCLTFSWMRLCQRPSDFSDVPPSPIMPIWFMRWRNRTRGRMIMVAPMIMPPSINMAATDPMTT